MSENTLLNGRYELLNRIGAGGMASVFLAKDTLLGRLVAVKMLHEGFMHDETFVKQFQHEAHAAANLTHPHIVTVHDMGEDRGRFYIVMEFIEGLTLKQIIRDYIAAGSPMPVERMLNLTIQICSGIGYAHRAGLVHCDVKPQNILVTADDRVKVADFGIARAMSQATAQSGDSLWGTPQYLAPEQVSGESPTPASDVYAIGIIMFEMLANEIPFSADTPTAVALKHLQEAPPDPQSRNPNVPRQLSSIIGKVLSKEPAGRYRSAGQLGRILSSYREQSLQTTGPLQPGVTLFDDDANHSSSVPSSASEPPENGPLLAATRPVREPASRPVDVTAAARPPVIKPGQSASTSPAEDETDWTAVGLGMAALLLLLGLLPLWFMVARAWGIF